MKQALLALSRQGNVLRATASVVLFFMSAGAAEPRRYACRAARFVEFAGVPLLGDAFPGTAVIALQGNELTLGECGTVTARIRPSQRYFSSVKAKWAPCGAVRRVRIRATIYEPCQFLVGVVRPDGLRSWKFRAENPDRLL